MYLWLLIIVSACQERCNPPPFLCWYRKGEPSPELEELMRRVNAATAEDEEMSLQSCLSDHTKEEVLSDGNEVFCSRCGSHEEATKVVQFQGGYCPRVLVLILKRFERKRRSNSNFNMLSARVMTEKIEDLIAFPIDGLDIAPFCSQRNHVRQHVGQPQEEEEEEKDSLYDLFAVCNHYGRAGFGHYTSNVREWRSDNSLGDQWFAIDDEVVQKCSEREVVSNAAYILFYRKRGTTCWHTRERYYLLTYCMYID